MIPPGFNDEDDSSLPEEPKVEERILISVVADDMLWRQIHSTVESILFKGACLIRSDIEDAVMKVIDAHYDDKETLSRQQLKEVMLHAIALVYKNL